MLGNYLKLSIHGASHAKKMTFALWGFPEDCPIDEAKLAALMERRAPGRDKLSTQRKEADKVVLYRGGDYLSGQIASTDMRPKDYGAERTIPRPGHADFGQFVQFGRIPTGGGKNSGRLTAPLCAAGGACLQYLELRGIAVKAEIVEIGGEKDPAKFEAVIAAARDEGDSVGGVIRCTIEGMKPGLGGPLGEGLESGISAALFAIPGVKGIQFGAREVAALKGSEYNDAFALRDGCVVTTTNRQGGILGGRASGMPIVFEVTLRPTPTIFKAQPSVDLKTRAAATCELKGRHDPCIVRRAVPVVEAATGFALADALIAEDLHHPPICLTLTGKTLAENRAQYESQRYFADMVEVRVDLLKKSERKNVAPYEVPTIFTFRKKVDGGAFEGDEKIRYDFFRRLLTSLHLPSTSHQIYVDFEEDFGDEKLVELAHKAGVKIVRSLHSFAGPVKNLKARLKKLAAAGDLAKVAFMPKTSKQVEKLFADFKHDVDLPPHVVLAMGVKGLATRVLAGRLKSKWTYASVGGLGAIGHLSPEVLVRDYRYRSITSAADVVYLPADQVAETNAAFLREDEDAVALPKE